MMENHVCIWYIVERKTTKSKGLRFVGVLMIARVFDAWAGGGVYFGRGKIQNAISPLSTFDFPQKSLFLP